MPVMAQVMNITRINVMETFEIANETLTETDMTPVGDSVPEPSENDGFAEPLPEARLAETLEEFEAMSPSAVEETAVLDDAALARGGMVAVKAFVRSEASAEALRQRRKRQRREAAGAKPVQVVAPADKASREAVKASAAAMMETTIDPVTVKRLGEVLRDGGLRARMVRHLLRA
jgi:hypothetical protein